MELDRRFLRHFFPLSLILAGSPVFAALPYDFQPSSQAVAGICAEAKAKAGERLAVFATIPSTSVTRADSLIAFSDIVSDLSDETSIPAFLGQVAVNKSVRDAGLACDTLTSQYMVDIYAREDIYRILKKYADKKEKLDEQDRRLLDKTVLDFKRNGLDLPPAQRARVKEIKQRIIALQNDFDKNIAENKETVLFTRKQLDGLPDDYIARLLKEGDRYKVSLDYPDYFPFMENARDPEARHMLEEKFDSRGGPANQKILAQVLRLRAEEANLLGYPTYADYALQDRMAKSPEEVSAFLDRLRAKLDKKAEPELKVLRALKKDEMGKKSDGIIHAWDWRYYDRQLLRTRYQVDDQEIKPYFPVDVVTDGLLEVYQKLLGVKFIEVKPAGAWHEDVRLFEIRDSTGSEAIAYFFMDLFPREGKYKHAASFTLMQGRLLPDGSYQKPVSAIVANFSKPTAAAPALLTHEEVETFFHEFGHIMHQTLTTAKYERFSGSNVAQDFVEAPSQMLENWVWRPEVLAILSGYYKDKTRKLPAELLEKMVAAKNVDSGLKYLRQDFFATVDMAYHTRPIADTTATYAELMRKIALIPMTPGTLPQASFTHLMDGYDAGYYGYLWSKVYAQDMFSRFEKEGVLNSELGREYRRDILEPGGGRDEALSLRLFLGRAPDERAFLKSIGLKE